VSVSMQVLRRRLRSMLPLIALAVLTCRGAKSQEPTDVLAAAAHDPLSAAMYRLPVQNDTYFGAGPNHEKTYDVMVSGMPSRPAPADVMPLPIAVAPTLGRTVGT
jgi:hypothetical protein